MSETTVKVVLSANIKYDDGPHRKGETITIKEKDLEAFQNAKVVAEVLEVVEENGKPLEEMTIPELKSYAEEKDIEIPSDLTKKAEILEFLVNYKKEE